MISPGYIHADIHVQAHPRNGTLEHEMAFSGPHMTPRGRVGAIHMTCMTTYMDQERIHDRISSTYPADEFWRHIPQGMTTNENIKHVACACVHAYTLEPHTCVWMMRNGNRMDARPWNNDCLTTARVTSPPFFDSLYPWYCKNRHFEKHSRSHT